MPRKPGNCKECGARCFGLRCMSCSHQVAPRRVKEMKPHWPTCSWWAETANFYADARVAADRMAQGDGINYQPKHGGV